MNNSKQDILQHIKGTGFSTPKDYFEKIETSFNKKRTSNISGFKVPNNYFENFSDDFISKNNISTEKKSGFKVPDNYFENVETEIISKRKKKKVIPLKRRTYYKNSILAIAASILLFFSISKLTNSKDKIYNIADTEIENWMDEGLVSFNTYEIEDMFSDADLNLLAEESDEVTDYLKYTDIEVLLLEK